MAGLDAEILGRWVSYLKDPKKDHPYLKQWYDMVARGPGAVSHEELQAFANGFEQRVIALFAEKHEIDDRNYVKLGGAKGAKDERTRQYTNLESLEIEKYYLWRDLASDPFQRNGVFFPAGFTITASRAGCAATSRSAEWASLKSKISIASLVGNGNGTSTECGPIWRRSRKPCLPSILFYTLSGMPISPPTLASISGGMRRTWEMRCRGGFFPC